MPFAKDAFIFHFSQQTSDGRVEHHAISAITLSSCPSKKLHDTSSQGYQFASLSKQIDLINSLYQHDASVTYAIRYISSPHPSLLAGGVVEACIFCKLWDFNETSLQKKIQEQTEQLIIQLCGSLPDYEWHLVITENEFMHLWNPINWKNANIAEVRRREEIVALDTVRSLGQLGFNHSALPGDDKAEGKVYFVHPFLPHPGQLERLLRIILLNSFPIVLTISLSPTRLTGEEQKAMLDQIAISEGNQIKPSTCVQRIQEQRATMIGNGLVSQLLNLQDAPFFMTISISSSSKLPSTLIESAGVAFSASVGESLHPIYTEPSFIQMGGYDTVLPADKTERDTARQNLETLSSNPWGSSLAPQALSRLRYLVNGHEAICGFRFPEDTGEGLPGFNLHNQRSQSIPHELLYLTKQTNPSQRLMIGVNHSFGVTQKVSIPVKDRLTHTYVVGQTGTGKSTLLKTMILSDINAHRGCALIDPHGDLFEEILGLIPPERLDDVVIIDPSDTEYPVGLNLLDVKDIEERRFITREMQAIMKRLLQDEYGPISKEWAGPYFFQHMNMNMLLTMSDPENPGTLLQYYQIYQSNTYWKRWIPLKIDDPMLASWVSGYLANNNYTDKARGGESSTGDYLSNKFIDFVYDPRLRNIFGQPNSTIDFQAVMDEGKILLVNLAKGLLGEQNSRFLGFILMAKIQAEIMKRARMPKEARNPFYVYVDEFQSLATENFTILLSEARKFGVGLILANQFIAQIKDPRIMQSIFGNVGTFLTFRLGLEDAQMIESQYLPYFDRMDITNLPNWQMAARISSNGKGLRPFTVQTVLPDGKPDQKTAKLVQAKSREKYTMPRTKVEEIIAASLSESAPNLSSKCS